MRLIAVLTLSGCTPLSSPELPPLPQSCKDVPSRYDEFSESGDNGSPVFTILNSPSQYDVRLNSIHWGQISWSGQTRRVFSGIWNIQMDLGALMVCDPWFQC